MILQEIQFALKAPKGQYNSFSKFKYRSCEDIVEAVKPVLAKHGLALILSDDIQCIGDRVYVKATATITGEKGEAFSSVGWAREPLSKKGMDESQITGAASSYARKYALNGLLAIDDTKDADTDEHQKQVKAPPKKRVNKSLVQKYVQAFVEAIDTEDSMSMIELGEELKDSPEHAAVWGALDSKQKATVKRLIHEAQQAA